MCSLSLSPPPHACIHIYNTYIHTYIHTRSLEKTKQIGPEKKISLPYDNQNTQGREQRMNIKICKRKKHEPLPPQIKSQLLLRRQRSMILTLMRFRIMLGYNNGEPRVFRTSRLVIITSVSYSDLIMVKCASVTN